MGLLAIAAGCDTGFRGSGSASATIPERENSPVASGRFVDVAQAAGLKYEWTIPGKRPLTILQTIGNGCAFLDYDNDENLDILLVGRRLALFKGDGKGAFSDVTAATGLDRPSGHFLGCAVGDMDGDGWRDLYISGYGTGLLLKNESGGTFTDVTRTAGLKPQPWGTSCAFADVDADGDLDLYVANYARFGAGTKPQLCDVNGILTSCGPRYYQPLVGVLYRNEGRGRFTDITKASGADKIAGKGLGVGWADLDGSGIPYLAIANDEMPGDLLRPKKTGNTIRYENVGELSGTAYDRDGNMHGGMGTDWGDYDNNGKPDLFVATFQGEVKSLYRNEGEGGLWTTPCPSAWEPRRPMSRFGSKFLDYDNDGWLDLAVVNGHVQDNIQQIEKDTAYRQATQIFRNNGGSPIYFEDVSAKLGTDLTKPIVGRGLATGDYDNDGRVDLLIVDSEGSPLLLHNEAAPDSFHWLGVRLLGSKSNRDGYGASVSVTIGARTITRHCRADGSYLSSSDPRVHFGLGAANRIDRLTIRWPSGQIDTHGRRVCEQVHDASRRRECFSVVRPSRRLCPASEE
jgi:hypothetical protein